MIEVSCGLVNSEYMNIKKLITSNIISRNTEKANTSYKDVLAFNS